MTRTSGIQPVERGSTVHGPRPRRILAGDIGGTKTMLALFEATGGDLRDVYEKSFPSQRYSSLEAIVAELFADPYLGDVGAGGLDAVCFGVAGPVHSGRVKTTNLPWTLEQESLAQATGAARVELINDLQATAYGMLRLRPDEFVTLQAGVAGAPGNAAVIAPGTGLGEASLFWDGEGYQAIASEAGHADFAARSDLEISLLQSVRTELGGRVSYERILSGAGVHRIYEFLRASSRVPEPTWLRDKLRDEDPNAVITEAALAEEDALCVAALELFCTILGAEAGNLALRCLASSGIYLGGGIPPKILPALQKDSFLEAFRDKGRFSGWIQTVPVRVALNPRAALLGAAHRASRLRQQP